MSRFIILVFSLLFAFVLEAQETLVDPDSIVMYDAAGDRRIKANINQFGNSSSLRLFDSSGKPFGTLAAVDGYGGALILRLDTTRILIDPDSITLFDESGASRVQMRVSSEYDVATMTVNNTEGQPLAQVTTDQDGKYGNFGLLNDEREVTILARGGSIEEGIPAFIAIRRDDDAEFYMENESAERVVEFQLTEGNPILTMDDSAGIEMAKLDVNYILGHTRGELTLSEGENGEYFKAYYDPDASLGHLELGSVDINSDSINFYEGDGVGLAISAGGPPHGGGGLLTIANTNSEETMRFEAWPRILQFDGETGNSLSELGSPSDGSLLRLFKDNDMMVDLHSGLDKKFGSLQLNGGTGNPNIIASSINGPGNDYGFLGIYGNSAGPSKIDVYAAPQGDGEMVLWGGNNNANVFIGSAFATDNPNLGYVRVFDAAGSEQASLQVNGAGQGQVQAFRYQVNDGMGMTQGEFYIDMSGESYLQADNVSASVKNFRMDHPAEDDKEIWFACIEGPEAAAYARGTATLTHGEATVSLPDYFSTIVEADGITLIVTPLSAESHGIAVVEKGTHAFRVKELAQGVGNYSFDWEIKAVRKGYKDYQVVRPKQKRSQSSARATKAVNRKPITAETHPHKAEKSPTKNN